MIRGSLQWIELYLNEAFIYLHFKTKSNILNNDNKSQFFLLLKPIGEYSF